jgi:drug/metabolite transporter (DMT)-like permease
MLILAVAWRQLVRDLRVIRQFLPLLLILGTTGSGLFNTLQYLALERTTATNAGIINSTAPAMIVAASVLLSRVLVSARQIAGILLSLTGVLAVLAKGDPAALRALTFNTGDLIMLGAMMIWAVYTALLVRRPAIHAFSFAAVTFAIAALLNLPLALVEQASGARLVPSAGAFAATAYVAIFPSFLAYLMFNRGVEIFGPARAGAFMHLVPLFTALLAILFLGEQPALYHAFGLALILAGVWLAAR